MPLEQRQKGVALAQNGRRRGSPATTAPSAGAEAKATAPKAAATAASPHAAASRRSVSGNWRIQLGAFSQRKSAEALFAKLRGKLAGTQAYYVPAGAVIRLQAGPFESRAAAAAACARWRPSLLPGRAR